MQHLLASYSVEYTLQFMINIFYQLFLLIHAHTFSNPAMGGCTRQSAILILYPAFPSPGVLRDYVNAHVTGQYCENSEQSVHNILT